MTVIRACAAWARVTAQAGPEDEAAKWKMIKSQHGYRDRLSAAPPDPECRGRVSQLLRALREPFASGELFDAHRVGEGRVLLVEREPMGVWGRHECDAYVKACLQPERAAVPECAFVTIDGRYGLVAPDAGETLEQHMEDDAFELTDTQCEQVHDALLAMLTAGWDMMDSGRLSNWAIDAAGRLRLLDANSVVPCNPDDAPLLLRTNLVAMSASMEGRHAQWLTDKILELTPNKRRRTRRSLEL